MKENPGQTFLEILAAVVTAQIGCSLGAIYLIVVGILLLFGVVVLGPILLPLFIVAILIWAFFYAFFMSEPKWAVYSGRGVLVLILVGVVIALLSGN